MTIEAFSSKTFADLDRNLGILELPADSAGEFPLQAWYRSIWHTPLKKLSIGDLCRACGQSIHLQHVVPLAIVAFEREPFEGDLYEGQLASSLAKIPCQFWTRNPSLAAICHHIARSVLSIDDVDFHRDIELLIERTTLPATNEL
jgi:hypothetical protein